jgi:hypothetical protein
MANLKQGINRLTKEANSNIVDYNNKEDFLRKWGLNDLYEFDGGDLWNINYDDDSEEAEYPMTTIRVGYGEPGWDEEKLLQEIESLGRWKRPEKEYTELSDKAIDKFAKGERLSPEDQKRYDKAKEKMSEKAKAQPERKYKVGQYNKRDAWNKQIDDWQRSQPDKKELFEKWRNFDDEKIEFTLALMELMGGK